MFCSANFGSLRIYQKYNFFFTEEPIMKQNEFFSILDTIDSTNNYATGKVHAGLATHGQAWFAREQHSGKGQRGKTWNSAAGENIILSIAVNPDKLFSAKPFIFSALMANICHDFFSSYAGGDTFIKWPNDIYWNDRKAGGILIENIFRGSEWSWSVIGAGININQSLFGDHIINATSLKSITGKTYNPLDLARELQEQILDRLAGFTAEQFDEVLQYYNEHLFKRDTVVSLKKDNAVFKTKIKAVNEYGQLLTEDTMERKFEFGEVSWIF